MKEETYNLQVPIDLGLAESLKKLAKEDDRNLRAYCRRILQSHVDNAGIKLDRTSTENEQPKVVESVKVEVEQEVKKPKVGGFNRS